MKKGLPLLPRFLCDKMLSNKHTPRCIHDWLAFIITHIIDRALIIFSYIMDSEQIIEVLEYSLSSNGEIKHLVWSAFLMKRHFLL